MAADEAGIMKDEVAGRLAERMALERREEVRDALGGSAAVWAQEAVLWAAVVPDRGGVEQSGDARRGDRRWAVTIRRRGGLGLDCRFRWGGRVLRVRFVEDDPRGGGVAGRTRGGGGGGGGARCVGRERGGLGAGSCALGCGRA